MLRMVSSDVLEFETGRCAEPERRAFVSEALALAPVTVPLAPGIERRAKSMERRGFHALDALRLASAEAAQADFFCACDDALRAVARRGGDLKVNVRSPLELAQGMMK